MSYYDFTKLGPSSISLFQFLNEASVLYKKDHCLYKNVDWHSYISKEELSMKKGYNVGSISRVIWTNLSRFPHLVHAVENTWTMWT